MIPEQALVEKTRQVMDRLISFYGQPTWRNPLPAVDELVSTILSQNTNDINRDRAFDRLKARFSTWEEVISAPVEEVIDCIRVAGLANQKGARIQQILGAIQQERGSLDLSFLAEMDVEQAKAWLRHFNGVGPKTAAIVLQFSLGIPAFPVDTHIYRITGRLGLRPSTQPVEETHVLMESLISSDLYYAGHLNLIRLGREICHARKPECSHCPLPDLCDFYISNNKN
jgi:endonuclease III